MKDYIVSSSACLSALTGMSVDTGEFEPVEDGGEA